MYSYISENNFGPSNQITVSTSYNVMTFTNGNKATIKDILLCEILGFHCTAVEVFVLLGCYPRFFLAILTLKDVNDTLFQNVSSKVSHACTTSKKTYDLILCFILLHFV